MNGRDDTQRDTGSGGMSMPGLSSNADMTALKNATGRQAEKQFLLMPGVGPPAPHPC